tara:strand:- start:3 stop:368 length:366 start_codon:yes stop_codon:yes gene_type:complete
VGVVEENIPVTPVQEVTQEAEQECLVVQVVVAETTKALLRLVAQDKIILDPINKDFRVVLAKVNLEILTEVEVVVVPVVLEQTAPLVQLLLVLAVLDLELRLLDQSIPLEHLDLDLRLVDG